MDESIFDEEMHLPLNGICFSICYRFAYVCAQNKESISSWFDDQQDPSHKCRSDT